VLDVSSPRLSHESTVNIILSALFREFKHFAVKTNETHSSCKVYTMYPLCKRVLLVVNPNMFGSRKSHVNSLYSVFRTFSCESNLRYVNDRGIWNDADDAKVLANRNSTADAFRADMLGSKWNMRRTLITEFVRRLSSIAMSENNNFKKPGLIVFDLGKIIQRYVQNFESEYSYEMVFYADYTMWPYHVDTTVELPFYVKK
jgi:hypothetical protein